MLDHHSVKPPYNTDMGNLDTSDDDDTGAKYDSSSNSDASQCSSEEFRKKKAEKL